MSPSLFLSLCHLRAQTTPSHTTTTKKKQKKTKKTKACPKRWPPTPTASSSHLRTRKWGCSTTCLSFGATPRPPPACGECRAACLCVLRVLCCLRPSPHPPPTPTRTNNAAAAAANKHTHTQKTQHKKQRAPGVARRAGVARHDRRRHAGRAALSQLVHAPRRALLAVAVALFDDDDDALTPYRKRSKAKKITIPKKECNLKNVVEFCVRRQQKEQKGRRPPPHLSSGAHPLLKKQEA